MWGMSSQRKTPSRSRISRWLKGMDWYQACENSCVLRFVGMRGVKWVRRIVVCFHLLIEVC